MIKIGFIGIGQCGGNIADVAYQRGFPALALNTSQEDLDALSLPNNKFIIGKIGGAAKDRKIAINELKNYYTEILENIGNWVVTEKIDVIIITFSTGGGTGSGMGPVLAQLIKKTITNKVISFMPVLPDNTESIGSFVNSVECMNQIIKMNLPTIIIDNNKFKNGNNSYSRRKLYDSINSETLDTIEVLLEAPNKKSKYGNIDNRDITRIFATPGYMTIGILFEEDLISNEDPINGYINCFDRSVYVNPKYDKNIKCMATISMCSEAFLSKFKQDALFSLVGKPLEIYEGIYDPDEKLTLESIVIALCGLSFPITRINQMIKKIEEEKESLTAKRDYSNISIEESDFSWLSELKKESRDDSIQFSKNKSVEEDSSIKKISTEEAKDLFDDYL